jgi:hypothetical protein
VWLDLLQFVPDTRETRSLVVMGDVAEAAEVRGVEIPTEDEAAFPVAGYFSELSGMSDETPVMFPPTEWMRELQGDDEIRAELGFSFGQVDAFASTGEPPDTIEVLLGRFDTAQIESTLAEVPYWSDEQEEVEHGGATYYRWLDDLEVDYDRMSPARPLGHGGRMWVSDDHVVRTRSDAAVEGAIDAAAGDDSLADDETFGSLAAALDHVGVYSVFLSDDVIDGSDSEAVVGFGADQAELDAYAEALAAGDHVLLEEVEAYGSAWGLIDGEVAVLLALAARDEDAAVANEDVFVERFENESSPISGRVYAEDLDLVRSEVDGAVTVFWFAGDRPTYFMDALFRRDPLVASGG